MQLILTVTRQCDLRCSYCPTAKDGWPSLTVQQALQAVDLFVARGGGDIKLFGGEPLLLPELVGEVLDYAEGLPGVRRLYLSTNGLGLTPAWIERLHRQKKLILTISMDGLPEHHRRLRRALPGVADSYEHLLSLMPLLLAAPRVVITQTIAPSMARHAVENFDHLRGLGLRRFNILPGYYLLWRPDQLQALREGLSAIGDRFSQAWAQGEALYLRNLFTWAPTPFFNVGWVVDADGSVHPSNLGLSGKLDHLREQTRVGTLDSPPTDEALAAGEARVNALLRQTLSPEIFASTEAADAELTALCRRLYPEWAAWRRARREAA